ncbi:uncharacterized protein DS421_12g370900 [Arachis hypogaea]|nr:uncharacterized protein DS421_12g370900 [Arachis hypogaea]
MAMTVTREVEDDKDRLVIPEPILNEWNYCKLIHIQNSTESEDFVVNGIANLKGDYALVNADESEKMVTWDYTRNYATDGLNIGSLRRNKPNQDRPSFWPNYILQGTGAEGGSLGCLSSSSGPLNVGAGRLGLLVDPERVGPARYAPVAAGLPAAAEDLREEENLDADSAADLRIGGQAHGCIGCDGSSPVKGNRSTEDLREEENLDADGAADLRIGEQAHCCIGCDDSGPVTGNCFADVGGYH